MLANQNADTINFTSEKKIVRPIKTLIRQISLVKNIVCGKITELYYITGGSARGKKVKQKHGGFRSLLTP